MPLDGQTLLVVGPGWLGAPAAATCSAAGARVWTLQRRAVPLESPATSSHDAPVIALQGDIRTPESSPGWLTMLPDPLDAILVCIAPSRTSGDDHQSTYPAALRGALWLAAARGCRSIVYTSSTGVYGRTDGGISREHDSIIVRDSRQGALLDAEQALHDATLGASVGRTILRVAGLYGPGRDPASRFGAAIPTGASDVWCNFSWRDDVIGAMVQLTRDPSPPGETRVFNCADGAPMRASKIARALGATRLAEAAESGPARSNQQISVEAILATGWRPSMPSVFDGLASLGHHVVRSDTPAVVVPHPLP